MEPRWGRGGASKGTLCDGIGRLVDMKVSEDPIVGTKRLEAAAAARAAAVAEVLEEVVVGGAVW